ncbi:MAG: hypothetical protein FXF49_00540 [Flexistipes sinusarabici]|uniref:Preprotein translocase subunit SecB n=1 Tax=Flexistipes sinusarabici TaxID=2352 RepID=A0A5D0MWW0_FLESI|nr:protein-export chaperone SecB [Flexistipes sinusarabici]TYB36684.1 MAG: hypothetical protein FXF49_00540 [Flexistipes sinusarabici]
MTTNDNFDIKKYNNLVKHIDLLDIKLRNANCKNDDAIFDNKVFQKLKINVSGNIKTINKNEDTITYKKEFSLKAKFGNKIMLNINAVYDVTYLLETEASEEYLKYFGERNVPINVWPFFRELCYSITSRMGIPPLTLPVIRGLMKK